MENPKANPAVPVAKASVAIIGTGAVAHYHAMHLAGGANARLVAVVDSNRAALDAFRTKWNVEFAFSSVKELFQANVATAVHICTPPGSHESLVHECLDQGLDVLVEKPVAFSRKATEELYSKARQKRLRLIPDYSLFYTEQMCRARQWIESGAIGRVVHVECLYHTELDRGRLEDPMVPPWIFALPAGPLHNFFTHPLYLVLQFTGNVRKVNIAPRHTGCLPQGVVDHLDVLIDGAKCSGSINVSLACRPSQVLLTILGENGRILVDFEAFQVTLQRKPARFGTPMRLLGPSLRGIGSVAQTAQTVWKVVRKQLRPYGGLKGLIDRVYSSSRESNAWPVPEALSLEVAGVEDQIVSTPGCWQLSYPHASTVEVGEPRRGWVAVTGGNGNLGNAVVKMLRTQGYRVRLLTRWQSRRQLPLGEDVEIIYGDARIAGDADRLVAGTEAVIHLAAGMSGPRQVVIDNCLLGTQNIASAVARRRTSRNVYVSSMAVFDYQQVGRDEELDDTAVLETVPSERSAYAEGKLLAEKRILDSIERREADWTIVRPSQIFGPGYQLEKQLGMRVGRSYLMFGGPRKRVRLVEVRDVVEFLGMVFDDRKEKAARVFNLTHSDKLCSRDLAPVLHELLGVNVVYFRSSMGCGVAWATRVAGSVIKGVPRISKRQAAYLFSECGATGTAAARAGWKPAASLMQQIRSNLGARPAE